MYFLVDFENVNSGGMQGCNFLLPEDTVEIFFGASSQTITNQVFSAIEDSGCTLKIFKLQSIRKNALDFYIASRLGELIGKGQGENFAIISQDAGFRSVQDYWRTFSKNHRHIILSNTITDSIVSANENKPRTKLAREEKEAKKPVSLEQEYKRHEQRVRIRKALENQFADTEHLEKIDEIETVFSLRQNLKEMYLSSLKSFGRANGTIIYNVLKQQKKEIL